MEFSIAGILVIPLVLGLVEFAKKLGVRDQWSTVLAVVLGIFFGSVWYGIDQGLLPAQWVPYIQWAVFSIGFGLAIPGLYDLGKNLASRRPR
jgi:hypothetical protein